MVSLNEKSLVKTVPLSHHRHEAIALLCWHLIASSWRQYVTTIFVELQLTPESISASAYSEAWKTSYSWALIGRRPIGNFLSKMTSRIGESSQWRIAISNLPRNLLEIEYTFSSAKTKCLSSMLFGGSFAI